MDRDSLYLYTSVSKYFIALNEMFRHSRLFFKFLLFESIVLFDRSKVVPVHATKHTGEAEE
jgi:hypothetical protein